MRRQRDYFNGFALTALFLLAVAAFALAVIAPTGACAGDEIVIGASSALTGKFARQGEDQKDGITMWMNDVNARGGLLGRKVKFIHYDDESSPEKCVALYEKLIVEDKVDLLFGPYSSGLTLKATEVAEKHRFPILTIGGASDKIWARGLNNVFSMFPAASNFMNLSLDFAAGKGLTRVAVVYQDTPFPKAIIKGVKERAGKNRMHVVAEVPYGKNETDFSDVIRLVKEANPDVVIGGTFLPDSEGIVLEAKRQNLQPKVLVLTVGPAMPDFGKDLGKDADGVMGVAPWDPGLPYPGTEDFVRRFEKNYGRLPSHTGAGAFGAGQVMEAALAIARSLDRDRLRTALRDVKTTTVFGPYEVDETGKQVAKTTSTTQWIDGQRFVVMPVDAANHAIQYPFPPRATEQASQLR